jgi:hypothetical protein
MNIGEPMTRANLKETAESAGGGMGTTQLKSQALNLFAEMSTVADSGLINHGSRTPHFPTPSQITTSSHALCVGSYFQSRQKTSESMFRIKK